jgi:hypothetical protein
MVNPTPSLVIRRHDPAQRRRVWLQLALAWLGSLLIVGTLVAYFIARSSQHDGASRAAAVGKEGDTLRARIAVLERSEQVAKAALADVQRTLREREEEVDGLRADLAFYGRLVGGNKREGLAVHALRIKPVKDSQAWNVVATLTQNFQRGQEIKGHLTMSIEGVQKDKLSTLDWNALAQGQDKSGIEYGFKYFQQVSGTIMLPGGFVPNRVIVRADGEGGRVEQEFSWKDAIKGEESDDVRQ